MKSQLNYLKHILDEVRYIQNKSQNITEESFYADDTLKRAFVRSIEIIGEATKNISDEFKQSHSNIEWKKMAGMRDRLIHAYFDVDYQIVWDIVKNKIPVLEKEIVEILSSEK